MIKIHLLSVSDSGQTVIAQCFETVIV